ncbi:MAG: hypothetical protein KGL39_30565 [Patescibacteria group bacterium]|nr:hypothetical protein [Patescibacteria group bacterium]
MDEWRDHVNTELGRLESAGEARAAAIAAVADRVDDIDARLRALPSMITASIMPRLDAIGERLAIVDERTLKFVIEHEQRERKMRGLRHWVLAIGAAISALLAMLAQFMRGGVRR